MKERYENHHHVRIKDDAIIAAVELSNRYITDRFLTDKADVYKRQELESLVKHFPTIKRARFWMTFGQEYLTHLRVIQNIGMARIDAVSYTHLDVYKRQAFY